MKKILILSMAMMMFVGCSRNNVDSSKMDTSQDANETVENMTDEMKDWYNQFETKLSDSQVTYSSKSSIDGSSIGAAEGYRYATEGGNIDIYRFEDGDDYDNIVRNKKIKIDGKERNVEVNGNMVIVSDELDNNILNIFRGLD